MAFSLATLKLPLVVEGFKTGMDHLKKWRTEQQGTRKETKDTTANLLKMWTAVILVTSASNLASSVLSGFGSVFGLLIDTALTPFLPLIYEIMDALFIFADWFATQPDVIKGGALIITLAAIAMWTGISLPALAFIGVVGLVVGAWLFFRDKFGEAADIIIPIALGIGVAFGLMWLGVTGPLLAIAVAIGVLVGAVAFLFVAWKNNWGGIQEKTKAAWEFIEPVVMGIWDVLKELGLILWDVLVTIGKTAWDILVAAFRIAWAIIGPIFDLLWWALKKVGGIISWVFEKVGLPAMTSFTGGVRTMANIVKPIFAEISRIADGLADAVEAVSDATVGLVKKGGNLVGKGLEFVGFAEGGVVRGPTLSLIGEAGPEAVVPLTPGKVAGFLDYASGLGLVPRGAGRGFEGSQTVHSQSGIGVMNVYSSGGPAMPADIVQQGESHRHLFRRGRF